MSDQYSSLALSLGIDTKQFNRELTSTSLRTQKMLEGMKSNADAFNETWKGLTAGIKDTKRIVSGILISQGFYALSNVLVSGASAALSFAQNMETAAISMEYFVKGADKANKAAAFLREMNTFAASTPFSTEEALSLSKYMQSVGVSMNTTKSFLTVITDTAAATGATEENLQRVVFGLGQMMTKGRIAGEEIRQLANANIPIYEILQEELKLTGEQISNIGKYWIDADKAVVAILNGLEKRYSGAADRISNTVTGMKDTIIDNLKIIAQEAGSGLYDSLASNMTVLRDALDRYREIVVTQGSMGLFHQIMIDIDATGELGNKVFALIGNLRQLGDAAANLYNAAKPIISLFGESLHASITVATVTLTSFAKVADGLVYILRSLGLTTGTTAQVISSLYIAYKASQWMGSLGQAAISASYSLYQTVSAASSILPASIRASAGLKLLTAGLAGLIMYGLTAFSIFSMLNNSFAGLDASGGDFSSDYLASLEKYEKEMAAYNEAIAKYQESFNKPYDSISSGADQAIADLGDVEKASKKAAGSVKKDWVASFDEVYSMPDDDASGGGAGSLDDLTLPDLGALLTLPKFVFPTIEVEKLEMPKFDWDSMYEGSLFSDEDKNWLTAMLPIAISAGAMTVGQAFAKKRKTDIAARKAADSTAPKSLGEASIMDESVELLKRLVKADEQVAAILSKIDKNTIELAARLDRDTQYLTGGTTNTKIDAMSKQLSAGVEEAKKLVESSNEIRTALGEAPKQYEAIAKAVDTIRQADVSTLKKQLTNIGIELKKTGLTSDVVLKLTEKQDELTAALTKLGVTSTNYTDLNGLTYAQLSNLLDDTAKTLSDSWTAAFTGALSKQDTYRYLLPELVAEARDAFKEFFQIADTMELFAEFANESNTIGRAALTTLKGFRHEAEVSFKKLLTDTPSSVDKLYAMMESITRKDGVNTDPEFKKLYKETLTKVDEQTELFGTYAKQLKEYSYESLRNEEARAEDLRRAREAAAAQREEQIALEKAQLREQVAARKAAIEVEAGRRIVTPSTKTDALYQDTLYRISNNTEATAIRLADISEGSISELKALRKELKGYLEEVSELRLYIESHAKLPTNVGVPREQLPRNLQDAMDELDGLKLNIKSVAEDISNLGSSVPKKAMEIVGEQLTTNNILRSIGAQNTAAYKALQETVRKLIPGGTLPSNANDAIRLADIQLPKALIEIADAAGISARSFMLTGTKLEIAARGIGSFGDDIPAIVARAFSEAGLENFSKLLVEQVNLSTQAAAALGIRLEDMITVIASQKMVPEFGSIEAGGFKAPKDLPLLTQIDSTMKIWNDTGKTFKIIANDVKTKAGHAFQALLDGSSEYAAGIRKLPAEILERVAPAHYAQFIAQAKATNTNMIGMSAFNRDFDFTSVDEALVNRWKQLMNRSGLSSAAGGKIFSAEALLEYGRLSGTIKNGIDTVAEAYFENVITPLLTTSTGIDFSPLQYGFQQYIIEFSKEAMDSLDIDATAKAFLEYNRLIATVADNPNITEFLQAYVKINTEAGEAIAAMNFSPVLRSYSKMLGNQNKWLKNILKIDESFARGAIGKPLQRAIDDLVNQYTIAVTKAANIEQAAELAVKFGDQMDKLAKTAEVYGKGGTLDAAFEAVFEGTKRSIDDMRLLSRALETIANKTNMVDRVPRLMRTAIDNVSRINNMLSSNTAINVEQLMSAAKSTEQLFDAIGISATDAADSLVSQLTDMHQIASRAAEKMSTFNPAQFGKLELPFETVNIQETLQYTAGKIKNAVEEGLLKVSDEMASEFNAVIRNIDSKYIANDFVGRLRTATNNVFSKFIIDLETTGLPQGTQHGKITPEIVQVSMVNAETGELYTKFIDFGSRNQQILAHMGDIFDNWKEMPADILNTGNRIEDVLTEIKTIVGDELVTGYNAVNYGRAGGAFDMRLISNVMGEGFLKLGDDVMDMVSKTLETYTGTQHKFKLTDIYEIISGGAAVGAHDATADVIMTQKVMQAVQDGTLEEIVRIASANGFEGGVKHALLSVSSAITNIADDTAASVIGTIVDTASTSVKAIDTAFEPLEAAAKAFDDVVDAAEKAAKATSATGKSILDGASEAAIDLTAKFTDKLKTFWQRMTDNTNILKASKTISEGIDLFDSFDELAVAAKKFEPFQIAMNKANAAMEAGLATPKTSWVKEAAKAYDDAYKEYSVISKKFYKNIIDSTNDSLKGFDNFDSMFKTVANGVEDGISYIAYVIDPKTGAIKLLNDNLLSAADELNNLFNKTAREALKGLDLADDAIGLAFDEFKLYTEGLKSADELSAAAKAIKGAFDEVGNTTVILDAAGKVKYAGTAAAEAVESAAEGLSISFSSISKKLIAGIGGFGLVDVIGIAIAGILQNVADNAKEDSLNYALALRDQTGLVVELDKMGTSVGKLVGESVYNGVWEVMGQETFSAAIGGLVTTALLSGIGTIPALLAAGIGAVISIGSDAIMNATGGKSDANLYLDDYLNLLKRGNVISEENFAEVEATLERQLTATEKKSLEEDARAALNQQLMLSAKNNFWDRDELNRVLLGGTNLSETLVKQDYSDTGNATKIVLRLAEALDLLTFGDESGIYRNYNPNTTVNPNTGMAISNPNYTIQVRDEAALDYLEDLLGAELKLGEVMKNGLYEVRYESGGRVYADSGQDIEGVKELINLVYKQGAGSGDMVEAFMGVVANNEKISNAIVEKYGAITVEAHKNFDEMLTLYNTVNGTSMTRADADALGNGFSEKLMEQMISIYNAYITTWSAQMQESSRIESMNRDITEGDTSSIIWNGALNGVTQEVIDELGKFGIALSQGSITVDTELSGIVDQTYIKLDTNSEALMNNIAGWRLDASMYEGLDLKELTLSADDVEILAQAGIQINSDGTIDFMRAINEEYTGNERGMSLDATAFSQSILDALGGVNIGIDFDTSELTFGGMAGIKDKMSGALFALPTNIKASLSKEMTDALSGLGTVMDSGYLMITNKAVLNGTMTIQQYVESMAGGVDTLSPKVLEALQNVDELIQMEGSAVADNIVEWANSVVVPSPLKADQITPEIQAAFNAIGVSFMEYGEEFLMVVNATGEHITDGVTLVDAEKWAEIDADVRAALEAMGVTVTEVGNQVMVDLGATFDNGIYNVVSLFTEQPDVWNQIPESVKQALVTAGIVTDGELLAISMLIDGKLTEIADGWVASWNSFDAPTKAALAALGLSVDDGVFRIEQIIDESTLPEDVDRNMLKPFEELPPEVQELLRSQTGLAGTLEGSQWLLQSATETAFAGMMSTLSQTTANVQSETDAMATAIATAVSNALVDIQRLRDMQDSAGKSGGFLGIGATQNKVSDTATVVGGVSYYAEYDKNGKIVKYHYYDSSTGTNKTVTSLPGRAEGGPAEGAILVGEKGRELAILPDGSVQYVGTNGAELVDVPAGTEIVNNKDTENAYKYVKNPKKLRALASGTVATSGMPDLTGSVTKSINTVYASLQSAWNTSRDKNKLASPVLLDNTSDGWIAFAEQINESIEAAFDDGYDIWETDTEYNKLRAYLLNESLWGQLPVRVSENVSETGRKGTSTWEQYVQANPLYALLLKQGTDSTGWEGLPPQVTAKVENTGKAATDSWTKYKASNPLTSLDVDASSWKLLEDKSVAYMQSMIKAMQKSLDDAQLKATITMTGAVSIGGVGGGYDNTVYETGGGFMNSFIQGNGYISSGFGMRTNPVSGIYKMHHGVDIAAVMGTPIKAGIDGIVRRGSDNTYGNYVDVVAANGSYTRMAHMSGFNKAYENGAQVTAGNIVGYVGSTGNSTGPHVHVEYHPAGGPAVDPRGYFFAEGGIASGLAMVAEKGRELAILPDGSIQLLNDAALYNLPDGTHIVNNRDTEKMLQYAGGINRLKEVRALEEGNTDVTIGAEDSTEDEFRTTFMAFMKAFIARYDSETEETTDLSVLTSSSDNTSKYIVENIHVAVRGAVAALLEHSGNQTVLLASYFDKLGVAFNDAIDKSSKEVLAGLSNLQSSLSSLVNYSQKTSDNTSKTAENVYRSAEEIIAEAKKEYAEAKNDAEREAAHLKAEMARASLGYSGGADGSQYIPISTISSNATGSIVTGDTLLRAGEFGRHEAILPLEQPSIMASLGEKIGHYVSADVEGTTLLIEVLNERTDHVVENIHVAIRGAVAALVEQSDKGNFIIKEYFTNLGTVFDEISTKNTTEIVNSLNSMGSSMTSALSGLSGVINNLQTVANNIGKNTQDALERNAEEIIAEAKKEYAEAKSDAEREAAHLKAELARASLGYSGGSDGSQYIPIGSTITSNATGSIVTGDTLLRAGEFGRHEAILPLEQPSVMSSLGNTIGMYVNGGTDTEALTSFLYERINYLTENMHVAIRGAVASLSEKQEDSDTKYEQRINSLLAEIKENLEASLKQVTTDVVSAISNLGASISNLSSSIGSSISNALSNSKNTATSGESIDVNAIIAEAKAEYAAATSEAERAAAHAKAEAARATLGYSGGSDGSEYIKLKGSASGSLVTKDALYRAGEFGLNEAIIPLERPDVLQKVGTAIANSMPVEQKAQMNSAIGMQNAGVVIQQVQSAYGAYGPQESTEAVVQRVLESVLPAMSMGNDDNDNPRQNLNVGVLIADEQGLKMLERKLYNIRQAQETRRL